MSAASKKSRKPFVGPLGRICVKCGSAFAVSDYCRKCKYECDRLRILANPERTKTTYKDWVARNKDKKRMNDKQWEDNNRDKVRAKNARYKLRNADKVKAKDAKRRAANPGANRIHQQNRRARQHSSHGTLSKDLVARLFKLQRGKCACCNKPLDKTHHVDHILPLVLGGANDDLNIQLLHATCNQQKGGKHPVEFMQSRGLLL